MASPSGWIVAVAALAGTAQLSFAQESTITACVTKTGTARFVASPADCKNNESPLTWNVVGPQGPQGLTGPQGPKGDTGPQGLKGDTGLQGPKGDTGPQGLKGDTGPQGLKGDTGPQGLKGDTGPQGLKGDTGPQGLKGDTGPQGLKGDPGAKGDAGPKGDTGPQGDIGPQGPKGDTGASGAAIVANFHCAAGMMVSGFDASGQPVCAAASSAILAQGTVNLGQPGGPSYLDMDTGMTLTTNDGTADLCSSFTFCSGLSTVAGASDARIFTTFQPQKEDCESVQYTPGPLPYVPGIPTYLWVCVKTNGGHFGAFSLVLGTNVPVLVKYVTWQ